MNRHKNDNRMIRLLTLITGAAVVLAAVTFVLPTPSAAAQGGWHAEYFPNRDLAGGAALTRYDDALHFEWGTGSPGAGIPADGFSARWTRDEWFESGTYRFSYRSDDGIRIWVGDLLVVDDWRNRQAAWSIVDRFIPRGTHRVRVEYYEHDGGAIVQASWAQVSGGAGWRGEYYANRDLSGSPVLVRYDAAIDFDWATGSPDSTVPADNFSVRWQRTLGFTAGTYRFHSSSDDGVRIYVDGSRIVDAWADGQLPNTRTAEVYLTGAQHTVVIEYYEHGGDASAHVWWNLLGAYRGWEGRYYDNAELRGGPALVRDDAAIDFDWGEGAPAAWMPADNFSVLWKRQVYFAPGYYRLNVRSDDGARVWLDDALVMDYWQPQDYQWHYVDGIYLEGLRTLKIEYFERGGGARIRFWWDTSGTVPSPALPAPTPTPVPGPKPLPAALGPWTGEYFNNTSLSGSPALVRVDAPLHFDWDWDAPAPQVKRDYFTARWTGTFQFEAGSYTFNTFSDDGVRVYVDDKLVIDSWRPMRGYRSGSLNVNAGSHTVKVEYFERNGRANLRFWWEQAQATATPVTARPPVSQPATCVSGPLRLNAWPVAQTCTADGWTATIFVEGQGGNCWYTYGWEGKVQGGPTSSSMTFQVSSAGWNTAIVGEATVTSAGQTAEVELFVAHPACQ